MRDLILVIGLLIAGLAISSRQIAAEVEAASPAAPLFSGVNFIPPQP